MKLQDAMATIDIPNPCGFRVRFQHAEAGILRSDYFPIRDEPLIPTEEEAWDMAERFAKNTYGRCVNIYVVDADRKPVPDCAQRIIENRDTRGTRK